jgi:pSer/pThr/pTyr-binding forkhead associated (FHA) protein
MAGSLVVDVLFKGEVLRTVPFDRPTLRIGRMRENDLVIDNLSVSRFHARLHLEGGRVFLEDGGSENGTYRNDQRVHGRVELAPGDRIVLGKHQLRVRSRLVDEAPADPEGATAPPEPRRSDPWDAQQTYLAGSETQAALRQAAGPPIPHEESESMRSHPSSRSTSSSSSGSASEPLAGDAEAAPPEELHAEPGDPDEFDFATAELDEGADEPRTTRVLDDAEADDADEALPDAASVPEDAGGAQPPAGSTLHAGLIVQRDGKLERIVPWEGDVLTVGRSSECDLMLAQDEVSRRHARLVRAGDRHEVCDLGSVNGTLVNGKRIERHVLQVGDVIQIEGFQLTFVLDRDPISDAVKPPQTPVEPERRDTMAMTILQEDLPAAAGLEAVPPPAPVTGDAPIVGSTADPAEATIANVALEVDLVADGLDEPFEDGGLEERKAMAEVRPRGSSRASSVQDLVAANAARPVTLELRLQGEALPEPLRRALVEAGEAGLVVSAELRLRLG